MSSSASSSSSSSASSCRTSTYESMPKKARMSKEDGSVHDAPGAQESKEAPEPECQPSSTPPCPPHFYLATCPRMWFKLTDDEYADWEKTKDASPWHSKERFDGPFALWKVPQAAESEWGTDCYMPTVAGSKLLHVSHEDCGSGMGMFWKCFNFPAVGSVL